MIRIIEKKGLIQSEEVVARLQGYLKDVIPSVNEARLTEMEEIILEAIQLRNKMTAELAVYRCFWLPEAWRDKRNQGSELYEIGEIEEENGTPICTMPGLVRFTEITDGPEAGARMLLPVIQLRVD